MLLERVDCPMVRHAFQSPLFIKIGFIVTIIDNKMITTKPNINELDWNKRFDEQ